MWGYVLIVCMAGILVFVLWNGCDLKLDFLARELSSDNESEPLKNIQPGLDRRKQIRKAVSEINGYLRENDLDRAQYALFLFNQMLDTFKEGLPQPWSNFQPMLLEEFS